jgi:hypothetical protein
MIDWVLYNDHKIKVCSQSLAADRWVPLALIWKSGESSEQLHTVWGDPAEFCKNGKEADSLALRKAKRWTDQHR